MRVALLCPYSLSVPGGVQGQVLGLARSLRTIGVDTRVIGPTDGPPPEPGVISVGPSVRMDANGSVAPMNVGPVASERTLEALRTFEPDVLHLHEPFVPGPTAAALVGSRVPKVGTFHAAAEGDHAVYRRLRKVAQRAARELTIRTAVSADAKALAEQFLGGTYIVLPNGVDVARFAAAPPAPSTRPAVVFVGRHEPRKGLGVLLDAWAGLDRDAVLWVVSDGPQTAELRARDLPGVEWLGRITDAELASRMRGATVFCAPSLGQESFGVVLLEAMAARAAVVASAIPGYGNVASDGVDALMPPPGDADALRAALRRVLDDAALRSELVDAGTRRAAEFSLDHLAERFIGVYETAIAVGP